MPWKSLAQERWGNSPTGRRKMGAAKVEEFNQMTKGMKLPKRVPTYSKGTIPPSMRPPSASKSTSLGIKMPMPAAEPKGGVGRQVRIPRPAAKPGVQKVRIPRPAARPSEYNASTRPPRPAAKPTRKSPKIPRPAAKPAWRFPVDGGA